MRWGVPVHLGKLLGEPSPGRGFRFRECRRCGLDAYSRQGHQRPGKREVVEDQFDFVGDEGGVPVFQSLDLRGDEFDGFDSGDGHGLPSAVKIASTSWTGSPQLATRPPESSATG